MKTNNAQQYWITHRPTDPEQYPDSTTTADRITECDLLPSDFLNNAADYLDIQQDGAAIVRTLKKIQGKPGALVTIYRGAPSGGVLNRGDWVTLSKQYAEQYANGGDYADNAAASVYSYKVPAGCLSFDGDDIHEFGYWGDTLTA